MNAKHHNTLFDNNSESEPVNYDNEVFDNDAPVLNDEYTTGDEDDGC